MNRDCYRVTNPAFGVNFSVISGNRISLGRSELQEEDFGLILMNILELLVLKLDKVQ